MVRECWYRQPVLWLATAILLASIAGCIGLIVLASRFPDEPVQPLRDTLLHVPTSRDTTRTP